MLVRLYSIILLTTFLGCSATTGGTLKNSTLALPPYELKVLRTVNANDTLYLDISITPNAIFHGPAFLRAIGLNTDGIAVANNKVKIAPNLEQNTDTIYTVTLPAKDLKTYKVELEWGKEPQLLPVTIISEDKKCYQDSPTCTVTGVIKVSLNTADLLTNQTEVSLSITMPDSIHSETITAPILSNSDDRYCHLEIEQAIFGPAAHLMPPRIFLQN